MQRVRHVVEWQDSAERQEELQGMRTYLKPKTTITSQLTTMGACIDLADSLGIEERLGICNDVNFGVAVLRYRRLLQKFAHGTIADVFADTVARYNSKPAIIQAESGETVTFGDLDALSNRVAAWLLGVRVCAGATVALMMGNSIPFAACWLGCTKIGASVAFINTYLKPDQLRHALDIVSPTCILCDSTHICALADVCAGERGGVGIHPSARMHVRDEPQSSGAAAAVPQLSTTPRRCVLGVWHLPAVGTDSPAQSRPHASESRVATPGGHNGMSADLSRGGTGIGTGCDHGSHPEFEDVSSAVGKCSSAPVCPVLRKGMSLSSVWGYVYTSGTTGMPKSATITHQRFLLAGFLLGSVAGMEAHDIVYCALPLYHSAGGMIGLGNTICRGCTFVLAQKFSTRRFWGDVTRYRATVIQYIGELCRFLVNSPPHPGDAAHCVRIALGNGLRPDVWETFQERFNIPTIVEFYASTEGNASLINVCRRKEARGAVGRYGVIARKLGLFRLVKCDEEKEELVRDSDGRCIPCAVGEVGELLSLISERDTTGIATFVGYHKDKAATERKIARDVFRLGDAYFRTGDLLTMSPEGRFYFVDRIGDTFRWHGENVASTEVAEAIGHCGAFTESIVYGAQIPGYDGRCGMAAVVLPPGMRPDAVDWKAVAQNLRRSLATYALPVFIRILPESPVTSTFKHVKKELRDAGADPTLVHDHLYTLEGDTYVPLSLERWHAIVTGRAKL